FLDGNLIEAPTVQQAITGGSAVISGSFTVDTARTLVERFNAGALPAPITLVNQQTINADFGKDALTKAIFAGAIGALAIIVFMLIYYRGLGVYASVALLMYIALTLAVFKVIPITLTLAGIAGFILSMGMAVDANILVFERTKEELKKGLSRGAAIEEGFKRAWISIRDSNVSTLITSAILYYFTSSFVKGFALTLFIGVMLSMFSAITITRTMLRIFLKNNPTQTKQL
ncbi:MAG: protein translocase subunit SecD, partial [Patescibacteria group bacterium]